jgi:hypothetical protein
MGTPSKKIPSKSFEKPLDKTTQMWYNNNVKRGTHEPQVTRGVQLGCTIVWYNS